MSLTLAEINEKFPVGTKVCPKGVPNRQGVVKLASEVNDSTHINCMGDRIGSAAMYTYTSSRSGIACVAVETEGTISLKVADRMEVVPPEEKTYTQAELDEAVNKATEVVKNKFQELTWKAEDQLSEAFSAIWDL